MKTGILGLPSSGKTTLFNLLTGSTADTSPFSRGRLEVNLGEVKVPDRRLDALAAIFQPKKTTYAEISFVDLAGLPGGANRANERAENLIPYLRDADALVLVLRDFESPHAPSPDNRAIDPLTDLDEIRSDLIVADLSIVERKLERLAKEKKSGDPAKTREYELFTRARECLEADKRISSLELSREEAKAFSNYGFLTLKGIILLRNYGEGKSAEAPAALVERAARMGAPLTSMNALLETEVLDFPEEERTTFYEEYGITGDARECFIHAAYESLDLISFFTGGEKDCHAWTIRRGTGAAWAAGKIHSDIERGFIRAEVIPGDVFIDLGSEKAAREKGVMKLEGKEYVVKDGDLILFRFSV